MRYVILASRILLGLMFIIPGLNKLLHFLPITTSPGDATIYLDLLFAHHILTFVAILEIIGSLFLLFGRYVPLGLTILGPISVNVFMFHLFLDLPRLPAAAAVLLLEVFLIWLYRSAFVSLFANASAMGRSGLNAAKV